MSCATTVVAKAIMPGIVQTLRSALTMASLGIWPKTVGRRSNLKRGTAPKTAKPKAKPAAAPKAKGKGGRGKVKGRGKGKLREVEEGEEPEKPEESEEPEVEKEEVKPKVQMMTSTAVKTGSDAGAKGGHRDVEH